ncbi:MAG TPA: alpha/beta hydrolase, partial [Actinoplanes sp.]|nr:alpha/beta hydrolase [Actinoplanes sp.]
QRRYVVGEYPELVGGLDGVPVTARDVANRTVLDRDHDALTTRRAELDAREAQILAAMRQGRGSELYPGTPYAGRVLQAELDVIRAERGELDGKLKGIDRITERLADADKPRAYLIGFSSADDGRAIVSVGNPDAADNVLTYVPGTGADLSKIGGDIVRADRIAEDAVLADPGKQTASMVWLGYDAPDGIPNAGTDGYADDGGRELGRFQSGLRATHDDQPSHNVVMGHSYGSTVIGHGITGARIDADAYVFVGSPGVGVNSVNELGGVQPAQVWATRAEHDMIKRIPDWDIVHGNDPTRADFGARVFTSDPGDPDDEGATHSKYWDRNNEARRNLAYIVTGQAGRVS